MDLLPKIIRICLWKISAVTDGVPDITKTAGVVTTEELM